MAGLNPARPGGGLLWIWTTAIQGIRGRRPLGDPFSPNQRTFGPFLREVFPAIFTPTVTPAPTIPPPTMPPPGNFPVPVPQPTPQLPDTPDRLGRREPRTGKRTPGGRRGESIRNSKKRPPSRGYEPRQTAPRSPWEPPPQSRRFPGRIINPNLPYEVAARSIPVLWRILGAAGGLIYPSPTSATDTILGRAPGSQRGPTRRPRIRPRPDPDDALLSPQPVSAPLPRPTPQPPRMPQPATPPSSFPAPRPTSSPTSSPTFNPLLLTPLAFLPRPSNNPRRLADPLTPTQPNPLTPPAPRPSAPPRVPPRIVPPKGLTPFQTPGLGSQPQRNNRCRPCNCRQPKKKERKKREPRAVCYRGTFYETAKSTRKFRKEKIPCQ